MYLVVMYLMIRNGVARCSDSSLLPARANSFTHRVGVSGMNISSLEIK